MLTNLRWRLITSARRIWVRAALYSLVGVAAALVSVALGDYVPDPVAKAIGGDAVGSLLQVIAASMLSVTIFALSTLVGALTSAAQASPRASRVVAQDPTAQSILAAFLGVFIFSLVGIIALSTRAYGAGGRSVLFLFTLALIVVIIGSLIRWIQHITQLGRLDDTVQRLESASVTAFEQHRLAPQLGGTAWNPESEPPDADATPLLVECAGYIQHFDLHEVARHLLPDQRVWIMARPGAFVGPNRPLALIARAEPGKPIPEVVLTSLRKAWSVGGTRSFDQDPRFGLCVLAEVASKALSPAVNDVGTAIGVLGRLVRVLATLAPTEGVPTASSACHAHILVAPITALEMLRDAFRPIARDGAGAVELGLRLQAALAHIARLNPPTDLLHGSMGEAAAATARDALDRARAALKSPADLAEVEAAAAHLLGQHPAQHA